MTILGSGAALPTSQRGPTSQYIFVENRHILIDCGEGTQVRLRESGIKFQRLQIILISHMHGDHFFGLVGLLSSMHLLGRKTKLQIFGPEELESIVRSQVEIGKARLNFELEFIALNGKENKLIYEDNKIEILTFPLKHRLPTNGFLLKEKEKEYPLNIELAEEDGVSITQFQFIKKGQNFINKLGEETAASKYILPRPESVSYAYCSDTAYWETIIPFIKGATALYHEATFIEADKERAKATAHSTALQAAKIAKKAGVGKLYLGHLSARYNSPELHLAEAKSIFEDSIVVEDGYIFTI